MWPNKYVLLACRLIVGAVFIWAGVSKIADPLSFAQNVKNYQLVGQTLSFLTAVFFTLGRINCRLMADYRFISKIISTPDQLFTGLFHCFSGHNHGPGVKR